MYEVERKVRVPHEVVRDTISAVDPEFLGTVRQRDTYFDHPVRDFATTDEALRVRREEVVDGSVDVSNRLTYKGPRLDSSAKTRIERESVIEDADAMVSILEKLGFSPAGVVDKTRERYQSGVCMICLDRVESLGQFIEIEASGSTEDIASAEDDVASLMESLGLSDTESIDASYLGMVLDQDDSSYE